ncbi:MAG: trigger factor [Candidatus Omnitrophica bacterium]|nr:trigger factor [Candidatus Omnitrophota bacterium]
MTITMKVSIKDGKACEKILNVEVDENEIRREFDEFYKSIGPQAKVPGFRPGKAPRNVLAMHYQNEARESVLKRLLEESYRKAIQEKSLNPISFPTLEDVDFKDTRLSYKARLEIRPKIKLSQVTGLSAAKAITELKAGEVDEALKRIQESLVQFQAVEGRPAGMGDVVIADYICVSEGKEIEKRSDEWFELREKEFIAGFSAQLVGAEIGKEREVKVKLPESAQPKEVAGKDAIFKITVKEIKSKILPVLDDEMAKEAGEFKTFAELKEKIERDLQAQKEKEAEAAFEKSLLEELLKRNKIDLPEGLVARRIDHLVQDFLQHSRARHGKTGEISKEEREKLHEEFSEEARRQVHLAFLLDEIALKENFQAAAEDLKKKYEELASQIRQPAEVLQKYYESHEDQMEGLRDRIRNEKAIAFIKKNAKVTG